MPIMSKANTINLATTRTAKELGLYDIGLCQAAGILVQGVQQQRDIADFDPGLAQMMFERVNYILRVTYEV
jgi:hypothetical protein